MKYIVCSDTHGYLPDIAEIADSGDFFIHAGDLCPNWNRRRWGADAPLQLGWLRQVAVPWLEDVVQAKHKVITLGNHDTCGKYFLREVRSILEDAGVILLINESITLDGIKFYGVPNTFCPDFCDPKDWAFDLREDNKNFPFEGIPACDVLISHSPPFGIGDMCPHQKEKFGSEALLKRIQELETIKLVVNGHIHLTSKHINYVGSTKIINAAQTVITVDI